MGNCWPKPINHLSTTTRFPSPVDQGGAKKSSPTNGRSGGGGGVAAAAPASSGESNNTPAELKLFTVAELRSATRNFRPDSVLGEGGFGRVFKGYIDPRTYAPSKIGVGMPVAVKKSNPDSEQGLKEWQAEVNFLGKFSHPNLVKLLGYCLDEPQFLLVYEYMQRGSLESHLFRKGAGEPMPWDTRINIAIGAARGLDFLHSTEKQVIFRDFKASNILLDGDFNAKLSDFGLAKLGPVGENSHVTTKPVGTYGYAAPEYIATGHLYVKSDVYGFGVVLLEILTGLRVLDTNRPSGQTNLVNWALPSLQDKKKLKKLVDPRLMGQYPSKAAYAIAELILQCLELDPKNRPGMNEVLEKLVLINENKTKPKELKSKLEQDRRDHHRPLHHSHGGGIGQGGHRQHKKLNMPRSY